MARKEWEIQKFATQIARESWLEVNVIYREYKESKPKFEDAVVIDDSETNLYVYGNGHWIIDGAQYLQDHRNIVAVIPIAHYNGPMELAQEIENDYDDSNCEVEED